MSRPAALQKLQGDGDNEGGKSGKQREKHKTAARASRPPLRSSGSAGIMRRQGQSASRACRAALRPVGTGGASALPGAGACVRRGWCSSKRAGWECPGGPAQPRPPPSLDRKDTPKLLHRNLTSSTSRGDEQRLTPHQARPSNCISTLRAVCGRPRT